MKITVGQIVHYYRRIQIDDEDKEPMPAMIVKIASKITNAKDGPWVGLCIFRPNGNEYGLYGFSEVPRPGYWTLPPKED